MKRYAAIIFLLMAVLFLSCQTTQSGSSGTASNKAPKIKDGPGEIVMGNGNIRAKGNFRNYKKEGLWIQYYAATGVKQGEGNYKNDKQDGRWTFYHKNGQKFSEGNFEEGQRTGQWVQHYDSGEREAEFGYRITSTYYPEFKMSVKAGVLNGNKILYYKDQKVKKEVKYINGKKSGIMHEYYPDGKPKEMSEFDNDLHHGRSNTWWPNGKLKSKGYYRNGKKYGQWHYVHDNGQPHMIGNFKDDQRVGSWRFYSPESLLQKEGEYRIVTVTVQKKVVQRSSESGLWKFYRYDGRQRELFMELALASGMIDSNKASKLYKNGRLEGVGSFQIGLAKGIYQVIQNGSAGNKILSADVPPNDSEKNITYRWTGEWAVPKKNGKWKEYYPNGRIKAEGEYMIDRKNGYWKVYNSDGSINQTESGNYMFGRKRG
ncbi:MAG TPA: hypothetical protein PK544_12855 [Spirochaetota bacterium]|nr:hypothetical protein [Spirochaetota bacterium]